MHVAPPSSVGRDLFQILLPARGADVGFVVVFQKHLPLLARHASFPLDRVALFVQFPDHLLATADVDPRIRRILEHGQQLVVTRSDPVELTPILAFHHDRQLKSFRQQLSIQGVHARLPIEVVEDFFHRALHTLVRMFFLQRLAAADVTGRKAFVQLAAFGFLSPALLHAVRDHRQLEFVERALNPQYHAVLRIGCVVHAVFIAQQHVLKTAEANKLAPILIVACQSRQFARGDETRCPAHHRLQNDLVIVAAMQGAGRAARVTAQQANLRRRPTELLDVPLHPLLPLPAFPVVLHLRRATLP